MTARTAVALVELLIDHVGKVLARRNRCNVLEDVPRPEVRHQIVAKPAGVTTDEANALPVLA
jgi:hypothetical protein